MTGPDRLKELFGILKISPQEFVALRHLPHTEAVKQLSVLKDKMHREWQRAVFELHPVRTGQDPYKTALWQDLHKLREALDTFQLPTPTPDGVTSRRTRRATGSQTVGHQTATMKP